MPFEQKYTDETREQSLARVLERREAEPGNRSIIRETAEQFEVGEQSLRGWIRAWEKANAPAASVIVEEAADTAEDGSAVRGDADEQDEPAAAPAPRRGRPPGSTNSTSTSTKGDGQASADRVSELEAEVAKLRRDRDTLKAAIGVLVAD
jgi:transposase-like protein